tara:strand:- start:941 stop:1213 length:273 start_codon:yes stop_codon:yes gene_type:complete
MGMGEFYRRKTPSKAWSEFSEAQALIDGLGLSNEEFIEIAGFTHTSFYRWYKKGKIPSKELNELKLAFAEYYLKEYNHKVKLIWKDIDEE